MTSPRAYYEQRIFAISHEEQLWKRELRSIGIQRGLAFLFGACMLAAGWGEWLPWIWAGVGAGIAFLCFLRFVSRDEFLQKQLRIAAELAAIPRQQLARLERHWHELPQFDIGVPDGPALQTDQWSALRHDLDLLGHASLYQWICRAHTPRGREILRDWIFIPAAPTLVETRSAAAQRLSRATDFCEQLELRGRLLTASDTGPHAFVAWAESSPWYGGRRWLLIATRVLPVLLGLTIIAGMMGWIPTPYIAVTAILLVAFSLLLSVIYVGDVHDIFNQVDSRQNEIQQYLDLLRLIDQLPDDAVLLQKLRRQLGDHQSGNSSTSPRQALGQLSRIMVLARLRHSSLFGLIHLLVQITTLLDFHILDLLERWQAIHRHDARTWFDAIGELEALASLATLFHDYPDWALPVVDPQAETFAAENLGHPLLLNAIRNHVTLGPGGTFLLVTGSNMSGKSTLLRAIGLNAILAQMGGPVCATRCVLPPLQVTTSMRIVDSLERGVSFFMAELQRLKQIVDQARAHRRHAESTNSDPGHRCQLLFLLDEILQGTNSKERSIAVARVLKHLTASGALGAVTTHDLELAMNPELAPVCHAVHFRESIDPVQGTMTFDYRMREGVSTTTNALQLLELVGLSDDDIESAYSSMEE